MNAHKLAWMGAGCALAAIPLLMAARSEETKAATRISGKSLMAVEDLKWAPMPGLEGAQQSVLWGDPAKGAHRIFYKWPAGTKVPTHNHTNGDRGVVISGTLSLAVEGATPKKLPPGSYFSLGGGVHHATAVEGAAPCVFYIEREGAFDVLMAAESGAKKQ